MPCTFVCLTPVVIATWPAIVSFVAGAATALGFTAVSSVNKGKVDTELQTEEVELEIGSVLEGYRGEKQEFVKDGVIFAVRKNTQGRLVVCAKRKESKEVLRHKAMTFANKIQQAYAYHKAMTQLRTSGFNVVDENIGQDQEIQITLRRF